MPHSDKALKVIENRLRRAARRQGLALMKSRSRDPRAIDYGGYWVIQPDAPYAPLVGGEHGASLEEVTVALLEEGWRRRDRAFADSLERGLTPEIREKAPDVVARIERLVYALRHNDDPTSWREALT
jgi:hypothetical protein